MPTYKSLVAQTIHYLSRPHEKILTNSLEIPAAWKGEDIKDTDIWHTTFSETEIKEIEFALEHSKKTEKKDRELLKEDFPLPTLAKKIETWREKIANGIGLQVIKGIPVEKWSLEDSERFFWCLGLYLGIPGAQNEEGDLLGHVRDMSSTSDTSKARLYKTASKITYHCDAADVVGLLCINKAKEGGLSRIASSVTVYNEILKIRPDLIPLLYKSTYLDTHGEGGKANYVKVPPCRYVDGKLQTFYHSDYFRSVRKYSNVPDFSKEENELLDLYDEIASRPEIYLEMDLQPGDIQLISNHTVIHARTDYADHEEVEKKRHLLRLWVSLDENKSFKMKRLKAVSKFSLMGSVLSSRVKYRLNPPKVQEV